MSPELPAILAGIFVASFASGLAGFAFNLVGAGILFHFLPPQETAPVMVVASLLIQGTTLGVVRQHMRWQAIRPYVIGGILGTPVGVAILGRAAPSAIVTFIGLLLVCYAGYMLSRIVLRLAPPVIRAGVAADAGIGFAGGILGGLGGFSGALPVMWGDLKGLRKDEARAVFQPFIVAMQLVAAISLFAGGFFTRDSAVMLATMLPVLAAGTWLGLRAYRVIPAEGFRVVLLGLLFLSGLSLIL
jgi:uncharacterized membrane protein YfcA